MTTTKKQTPKSIKNPKMIDNKGINSGVFSNIVNISTNNREFFFDFGVAYPTDPKVQKMEIDLVSRITMNKDHASEFRDALDRVLKKTV